jgi:hypothetical protein
VFTAAAWESFAAGVRDGEFDLASTSQTMEPRTGVKRLDLVDTLRAGSVPVALVASAGTSSVWFLVAAVLYYRPVHDFFSTVLQALARRLARRIDPG